jgi:hypothetical protein
MRIAHSPSLHRATSLILYGLGAYCVALIVTDVSRQVIFDSAFSGNADVETLFELIRVVNLVSLLALMGIGLVCAAGVWRLRAVVTDEPARARLAASTLFLAILTAAFGAIVLLLLVDSRDPALWRWMSSIGLVGELVAWPLLALAAARLIATRQDGQGYALFAVVMLASLWCAGLPLVGTLHGSHLTLPSERPWLWTLSRAVALGAMFLALRALLQRVRAALAEAAPARAPDGTAGWFEAAAGLRLFASGLVARIVAVFGCTLLVLLAFSARSFGMLKLAVVCLPVAGAITGAVMCAGLYRALIAPAAAEIQGRIGAALALWVTTTVIHLYGAVTVAGALGGRLHGTARIGQLDLATVAMVTASFLLVLSAVGHVAERIGRVDLARVARLLMPVAVVALGGAAWLLHAGPGLAGAHAGVFVFVLLSAIATLVTTLAIARIIHRISDVMVDAPNPAPARIHRG